MPQDNKLVKLNKLPMDKEELGEYLIAAHELARRVLEGTYPAREMAKIMRDLCEGPKVDPHLYAARQTAEICGLETKLLACTHLALMTHEEQDALKAFALAKRMLGYKCYTPKDIDAIYSCIALIYYNFNDGDTLFLTPLRVLLDEQDDWREWNKKLDHQNLWTKIFFKTEHPSYSDVNAWWHADCDEALQLGSHPLFDDYLLFLVRIGLLYELNGKTLDNLISNIAGYYAKAKALCLLKRFDELRASLDATWIDETWFSPSRTNLHQNTANDQKHLDVLLAASVLFKHTHEPRDLSTIRGIMMVRDVIFLYESPSYHNLPAITTFHTDFWQNIAEGVEPKENLATTGRNILVKMQGAPRANAACLTLLHPDSWLNIYLQPYFHFNDETCDPDHPVFDPERRDYSISQKIAAYLVMAEDWPGEIWKRDHLERAYNYALALPHSYYKVLVLCDIYELKVRFGLDKKNKRD